MSSNLMLEQYSRPKKLALKESPYRCLLDTDIELNPHQINAFCAAIKAIKSGGLILADEVGLGKTIEAGLTLKYVIGKGMKRILIVLPATLRKQWEVELEEKFSLSPIILDRLTVEHDFYTYQTMLEKNAKPIIVLASYDYSSKLMKRFPKVKWDFIVIDEAHNFRNLFRGTKRAKNLYELSKGIPKILLTATPLQNSLSDLHALISFIDPRIFGSEMVFNRRFIEGEDYSELKACLTPVLYRTLRRDVGKYMNFCKRQCITMDFALSVDEGILYSMVNNFLKRESLYSIPTRNGGLIMLVIRKLLASSSFALVDTFRTLKKRLEKLYEGTRSADAQDGFNMFWEFVEAEIDESDFDSSDDEDIQFRRQQIQDELDEVNRIIKQAKKITSNSKIVALEKAIKRAFEFQKNEGIPRKVVIFTESKRTQRYIAEVLRKSRFGQDDILLFNGDCNDEMTKEIYRAWQVKNFGKTNYGRSVEYKHAIVDYFKSNAKILIVTDAGSEGLNLQFCNTVINYDLPWNPQKIEQRIGRCHRYGQKYDVVAINLLNTQNEADKRVYDILSRKFELFDGVFGASDTALGILESGMDFEKKILEIYQTCNTAGEFKREFDKLDRQLEAKCNKKAQELRNLLLTESSGAKGAALEKTKADIDHYLRDVDYWEKIQPEEELPGGMQYWRVDEWGIDNFGSHGTLFLGAFCDSGRQLFPVLLLCDENGDYIDFEEKDIVHALENLDDQDVHYFKPTPEENARFQKIYDRLTLEMLSKHTAAVAPEIANNRRKVENWVEIQTEQLNFQIEEMNAEIEELLRQERASANFLEKVDLRKKVEEKRKHLQTFQESFHSRTTDIQNEAQREIEDFNKKLEIQPILLVNVILKF